MSTVIHTIILSPSDLLGLALQHILNAQHIHTTHLTHLSELDRFRHKPHVMLIDEQATFDDGNVFAVLNAVQQSFPQSRLIVLAASCQPSCVWQAVRSGVKGYLCLQDRLALRLPLIIQDVVAGGLCLSPSAQMAFATTQYYREQHLTAYQRHVLRLMAKHWTAPRIGRELGRTAGAIYQVQRHLREVLDAATNGELVQKVTTLQLLENIG